MDNIEIEREVTSCCLCGASLDLLMDLPDLPLTDTFCDHPKQNPDMEGFDQALLYCQQCGHGQLQNQLKPGTLYGSNYCFRTSTSATARKGTDFLLSVFKSVLPQAQKFNCILDVGCNDLYLLELLKERAKFRIGIDPIWKGQENSNPSLKVIGTTLEDVDPNDLPETPDLIFCRHTLEHIMNPTEFMNLLRGISSDNAIFVFEFPGFDALIQRLRFDQVFHQHLQYFSKASFEQFLTKLDFELLGYQENYHDWGATAFVFEKGSKHKPQGSVSGITDLRVLKKHYDVFLNHMETASDILSCFSGESLYGYGAAQMLPVLGYHLKTDFSNFNAILDDGSSKDGVGYWNLPVKVLLASKANDIQQSTVLITAVDNVQLILPKLLEHRPRHIIYPLSCI